MDKLLHHLKSAAYTSVGVNLLITDAIVGREVPTPDFLEDHATKARSHATTALTDCRAYTEPRTHKLSQRFSDKTADKINCGINKTWDFIGIKSPHKNQETSHSHADEHAEHSENAEDSNESDTHQD